MPHGNRPEETSPTALESAAHDLRRILCTDGAQHESSLAQRTAHEARVLRDWAQTRGLILDPARWLAPARKGGAEHLVWRDDGVGRVIKLTLPGECGGTVDAEEVFDEAWDEWVPRPHTRIATPLEYLDRLLLANELFGDDIALLGVLDAGAGMQVVTSQPTILGDPPEPEDIAAFMTALGFARLHAITRRASLAGAGTVPSGEIVVAELRMNPAARTAALDGQPLTLTPGEFDMLLSLARAKGRVKTREALLSEIRDREWEVFDRAIDVQISALRKKLGDDPKSPRFIRTVRSAGYMLVDPDAPPL